MKEDPQLGQLVGSKYPQTIHSVLTIRHPVEQPQWHHYLPMQWRTHLRAPITEGYRSSPWQLPKVSFSAVAWLACTNRFVSPPHHEQSSCRNCSRQTESDLHIRDERVRRDRHEAAAKKPWQQTPFRRGGVLSGPTLHSHWATAAAA